VDEGAPEAWMIGIRVRLRLVVSKPGFRLGKHAILEARMNHACWNRSNPAARAGAWAGSVLGCTVLAWSVTAADPAKAPRPAEDSAPAPAVAEVSSPVTSTNRLDTDPTQRRLIPAKDPNIDDLGGAVGTVTREPAGRHSFGVRVLRLINPLAPASVGTGGAVTPGFRETSMPRAFRNDRTDEPCGIALFRWWFPKEKDRRP